MSITVHKCTNQNYGRKAKKEKPAYKLYKLEHSSRLMSPTTTVLILNQALSKYLEANTWNNFWGECQSSHSWVTADFIASGLLILTSFGNIPCLLHNIFTFIRCLTTDKEYWQGIWCDKKKCFCNNLNLNLHAKPHFNLVLILSSMHFFECITELVYIREKLF